MVRPVGFCVLATSIRKRRSVARRFTGRVRLVLGAGGGRRHIVLFSVDSEFRDCLPLTGVGAQFAPVYVLHLFTSVIARVPRGMLCLSASILYCRKFDRVCRVSVSSCRVTNMPSQCNG